MRVVLAAAGAEDARLPVWGHAVRSLKSRVDDVFPFDHVHLATTSDRPEYQRAWCLDRLSPDLVVTLGTDAAADAAMAKLAAERGIDVAALSQPEMCWPAGFAGPEVAPDIDVLITGPADDARAEAARALKEAGVSVVAFGDGWHRYPDLWSITRGPVPYALLPSLYRSARICVVTATDDLGASEAALAGRPAVVYSNSDAWTEEVAVLLRDEKERQRIAGDALKDVLQHRNWDVMWKSLGIGQEPASIIRVKEGPKFTVLTALYNIEEYIGDAIESVLNQTFGDFELLVCNDGTPDKGRSVVERYLGDSRVRLVDQENIGQTGRFDLIWRSLLRSARGEIVTFLGGDDVARPDRLERCAEVFQRDPGADIVHTAAMGMNASGEDVMPLFQLGHSYDTSSLLRLSMTTNLVAHPTASLRASLFERMGELEEGFAADYHFWLKAARHCRFRYLPEVSVSYRVHAKGASTTQKGIRRAVGEAQRLTRIERYRHTIEDFYPMLRYATDGSAAVAAAHADLGNCFLGHAPQPEVAMAEYETALSLYPPAIDVIRPAMVAAQQMIDGVYSRPEGGSPYWGERVGAISTAPFETPASLAHEVIAWDGTPLSTLRLLCVIDWNDPGMAPLILSHYFDVFRPEDPVDLIVPTLDLSEEEALERLLALLPSGIDFEQAASLVLDRVDDVSFVSLERYALVANCREISASDMGSVRLGMQSIADELRTRT